MKQKLKRLTYRKFSIDDFKRIKSDMENFRRNCHGENMESLWSDMERMYTPKGNARSIKETYTLTPDGQAIPDKLFLETDDDTLKFHEPLVGIKVHTGLSILTQRTPNVVWDSDNRLYERHVPVLNALRASDWHDERTRQQYTMMWFYYFLFGTTFWRRCYSHEERTVQLPVSYDPSTGKIVYEKKRIVERSQTIGEAFSPFDVLIDPNTKPFDHTSLKRVIYTKYFSKDAFYDEFKDKVSKEVLTSIEPQQSTTPADKVAEPAIRVDYFEDERLDLYYVVANDKHTLIKSPLPYRHKKLSIMMASWMPRSAKNPYGLGPVEMMSEDAKAVDEFKSMTLTQAKFSIYKSLFYQGALEIEGSDASEIRIRPDRAYKVSSVKDMKFHETPGPGQDAWRSLEFLRARTDDASGITRPLGGEITKSTAFEIDLAKDAALARLSVPLENIIILLSLDAERTFELQKQYYSEPEIKEIVDPDQIDKAIENIAFFEQNNIPTPFSIFVEDDRIYAAKRKTAQLNLAINDSGDFMEAEGKSEVIITEDVFAWKGRMYLEASSLLTITPSVERTKKLELFNLLIPLFSQPPELVAKPAKELIKLYGEDYRSYFPESWILFLEQLNAGIITRQQAAQMANNSLALANTNGNEPGGAMTFEQERASQVVTNVGGQKDSISSSSQGINKSML